ncbi:ATP-binding protein [Saccharothrix variisporea]|uniref:Tetratricopeptide repeat protein n=1 Tax=Saccharothrix variisporea TaxID=543527 RepID=A0A495XQM6_9PSEU|nr:XRE family transcriptional regulator [Saccharothrix variisporea]RKT74743.1 tetratricopeptide repeat protein [Saccharothrix variisporea]
MPGVDAADVWQAARRDFGERLRSLRGAARLSQKTLAKAIGSSDSTLSELENGQGALPPKSELVDAYVDKCLEALGTDTAVVDERRKAIRSAYEQLVRLHDHLGDIASRESTSPAPGPVSPALPLNTLRRDTHAFTGREGELALLVDAVDGLDDAHRVVAVHAVDGMPGVGKTTFALHAAHRLADRFPDGQLFLNLHGHSPTSEPVAPHDALASLLTAVGVDPLDLPADLDRRSALWRSALAGKRVLLVLDNAADDEQVEPLLPGEGRCLVLVTSRRRLLGLDAVPVDLEPLPTGEAEELFRRAAARPISEPEALTAVAELCGGLPLALTILAARFRNRRALTVGRLVEELTEAGRRLSALRSGNQAVAAAFELSYRDLPPERQRFFRLLGLHPREGIERYSTAALCGVGVDEAQEHLTALYNEHLVDELVLDRFDMHDLITQYVLDLLEDDDPAELATALGSMLDFYEQAAGVAGDVLVHGSRGEEIPNWFTGAVPEIPDDPAAMSWFDQERANLLSCLEATRDAGRIVGLTLCLAPYLRRTGPWDLALGLHRRAAAAARVVDDVDAEGQTLLNLGKAAFQADLYDEAQDALRAAGRIFTELGDRTSLAHAMMCLGQIWMQTGEQVDAHNAFSQALATHERDGNLREVAAVLVELGTLHYYRDEYPESIAANERASRLYEEAGDRAGQATALKGLSHAWLFSDDYGRAEEAAKRARELYRASGNRFGEAQTCSVIGSVRRARGQHAEAREDFEFALGVYEELGDRAGIAMALIELGVVLYHLGDFALGERTLRRAVELYEEFGEPMGAAAARKELADLLTRTGRLPEAKDMLDEAEAGYQKLDDRLGKAATSNSYGAWHLASGDPRTARRHHDEALRLALEIASPLEQASALAGLGRAARALGEGVAADRALREALAIYQRIGAGEAAEVARELAAG